MFTGGEPLIQEKGWCALMKALSTARPGARFEIETNGTLLPGVDFLEQIDQINVSPKLTNSGVVRELRHKPDVLKALSKTGKADFKFVIGTPSDLDEVLAMLKEVPIAPDHVFLMPKALTVAELEANQTQVADLARVHGFRYSDRLHLRLFGAKRGV